MGVYNRVEINIIANSGNAAGALQQIGQSIGHLGVQADTTRKHFNHLTSSVQSLLAAFSMWRAIDVVRDQLRELISVASDFQKLDYGVARFSKSVEDFNQKMAEAEKLGLQSFGIRNMERAFLQLNSVGLQPTEKTMQGLVGYLMTIGKTSPSDFNAMISKMTELYQLGNVGMDDALKELSAHVPFLMRAVKEKLKIGYADLYNEFKKKNMDFATIIGAIFEYAEKHFQDGIKNTEGFWAVLQLNLESRKEKLRKSIMQSGAFDSLTVWVQGIIKEFDKLAAQGAIERWADKIGKHLQGMVQNLVGGTPTVEGFLDAINKLASGLEHASHPIGKIIQLIETLYGWIDKLLGVIGNTGVFTNALTYGILGAVLFGPQAGAVIGAIAGVVTVLDNAREKIKQAEEARKANKYINDKVPAPQVQREPWMTDLDYAMSVNKANEEAAREQQARYTIQAADELDRKLRALTNTAEGAVPGLKAVNREITFFGQKYNLGSAAGALGGAELPDFNKIAESLNKTEVLARDFEMAEAQGSKIQFAREKAMWDEKLRRVMQEIQIQQNALQIMQKNIEANGSDPEDMYKLASNIEAKRQQILATYNNVIAARREYWDRQEANRWEGIDSQLQAFEKKILDNDSTVRHQLDGLRADTQEADRQYLEAQKQNIYKKKDDIIHQMVAGQLSLAKQRADIQKQMDAAFDLKDPAVYAKYAQILLGLDQKIADQNEKQIVAQRILNELVQEQIKHLEKVHALELEEEGANLNSQWMQLTGTIGQVARAQALVIRQQAERQKLTLKDGPNNDALVDAVANEKIRLEILKATGTELQGFEQGMRDLARNMETPFQRGYEGAKLMKSAFDSVGDSIADLVMTGTVNLETFGNTVIKQFIKMAAQMVITDRLFSAVLGWLGIGYSPSGMGFTALTPAAGSRLLTNAGLHHAGGMAGTGWPTMMLPTEVYRNAVRLHNGTGPLGADEYPAVLLRGERVLNRRETREYQGGAGRPTVVANINVTTPAASGSAASKSAATNYALEVSRTLEAEFTKILVKQMRPGGVLNKGAKI